MAYLLWVRLLNNDIAMIVVVIFSLTSLQIWSIIKQKQLQKIVKAFKRQGGIIQMSDATDAYLANKKAEAITYNSNTILLRQRPGRAAVFEELIHVTQYRLGRNDGSERSRLVCEIEAQEKLLKFQKAYKLTQAEVRQTERALKKYKEELKKL